jgi:uncharacterized membrane protein
MSENQKQTEFLKACLHFDDSSKSHKLAETITRIQKDERGAQYGLKVTGNVAVVAVVGLAYSAIFLDYYPEDFLGFTSHLIAQIFCVMGLVSILCLLIFAYIASVHRKELNRRHMECREAITTFLESHFGKPAASPQFSAQVCSIRKQRPQTETSPDWEGQHQTNTQQKQLS